VVARTASEHGDVVDDDCVVGRRTAAYAAS
jgi:hypothetical protein